MRSTQGWVSAAIWSSSLCEEPGSCSYCEQPVACCYKLRSRQATTRRVIKRSCLTRPGGAGKPGLANSQGLPHAMGGQAPRGGGQLACLLGLGTRPTQKTLGGGRHRSASQLLRWWERGSVDASIQLGEAELEAAGAGDSVATVTAMRHSGLIESARKDVKD